VLVALTALLYNLWNKYWIYIPGILLSLKSPVAKNQRVSWDSFKPDNTSDRAADNDPNIILILVDDLGFNDISFYGGGVFGGNISTPHIDSIAHNGVSFLNAYTGHATCAPSRAALMTGRYATRVGFEFTPTHPGYVKILGTSPKALRKGIYHKHLAEGLSTDNMTLPLSEVTMAQALADVGYRTLMLGKWHLGDTDETKPIRRGFHETLGFNLLSRSLPPGHTDAVDFRLDDMLDKFCWANVQYAVSKDGVGRMEPEGYLTDYFAEEASRAIEANRYRKFFMYMSFLAPHTPLQAHKKYYDQLAHIEDELTRVYGAIILALDNAVGRILRSLKDTGLEDNTMVIFTNDNGAPNWIMRMDVNRPYRGWKGTLFEGGIRTPLFMQWPRVIPAGTVRSHPVSHIDLFPTILSSTADGRAALSSREGELDGVNLLPYVTTLETPSTPPPHETLYWRSGHYSALRRGEWKVQVAGNPNKKWLFNLKEDPAEHNNLADVAGYENILYDMVDHLNKVAATQREPIWPSITETAIHIDKLFEHNETLEDEYVYWPN